MMGETGSTGERVMIVEDDAIIAQDLRELVERWGHAVVGVADSLVPAIELAEQTRPTVLLCDINLTDSIDGITVAREIHDRFGTAVVFLSGNLNKAVTLGRDFARAIIGKPMNPKELREVLADMRRR